MVKKRMASTTVQLNEEQFKAIYCIRKENDCSIADVLRAALDFYIEQKYPNFLSETV